jgi:hypothetical protein
MPWQHQFPALTDRYKESQPHAYRAGPKNVARLGVQTNVLHARKVEEFDEDEIVVQVLSS